MYSLVSVSLLTGLLKNYFITSRASFGGVPCAKIRHTVTTHEVWRVCLQLPRPIGVELTS